MIDTDWQDEEWRGPLSPDVLAWFRARLEVEFQSICDGCGHWFAKENYYSEWDPYRDEMVQWFVDHAEDFVGWVPTDSYRGEGWSSGEWVLKRGRINTRLDEAKAAVMYPDLDSWLRADLDGSMEWSPKGWWATHFLKGAALDRYKSHTLRVSEQWPIVCRDCRKEFRRDRAYFVRCTECRDQARTARRAKNAQA